MIDGPLRLKVQIHCGDEPAFGPGRAALLAAIDEHGSITAAGQALGMSYRRCWLLVDSMNRCWTERLVEANAGGKQRGARLSATGRAVLAAYHDLEQALGAVAASRLGALTATLRQAPLASHATAGKLQPQSPPDPQRDAADPGIARRAKDQP